MARTGGSRKTETGVRQRATAKSGVVTVLDPAVGTGRKRVPALTFGWRLRMARTMAGYNTTQAAEEINISPASMSAWEREVNEPRYGADAAVEALAAFYEADAQWILTGIPSEEAELPDVRLTPVGRPVNPYQRRSRNGDTWTIIAGGGCPDQDVPVERAAFAVVR